MIVGFKLKLQGLIFNFLSLLPLFLLRRLVHFHSLSSPRHILLRVGTSITLTCSSNPILDSPMVLKDTLKPIVHDANDCVAYSITIFKPMQG